MNNIIFFGREGFEKSLFPEIKDNLKTLTKDTIIGPNTDYVVFEQKEDELKNIFNNIIKLDQTNIKIKFVVSHPCIAIAVSNNPENETTFEYFITLKKCIDSMSSLFNAKFEVLKYEDLYENCTVDYNKYMSIEESKHFNQKKYLQLIDLCRYLPKDRNPMDLFEYNEIPLSTILKQDEELSKRKELFEN